jgi:hypothetical protein
MIWLIIPENKIAELDALNAQHTDRQCTFIETTSSVRLTSADKLSDPYWSDYHAFLNSLERFDGTPVWPVIEEEE